MHYMGSTETVHTNGQITAADLRTQLAQQERAEMEQCIRALHQLAGQMGFVIVAAPALTAQGTLTAQWGVQRSQ